MASTTNFNNPYDRSGELNSDLSNSINGIQPVVDANNPAINRKLNSGQTTSDKSENSTTPDANSFTIDALEAMVEDDLRALDEKAAQLSREEAQPKGVTQEAARAVSKRADTTKHKTTSPVDSSNVGIDIAAVAKAAGLDANDVLAIYTYLCGPGNINLLATWVYLLYNGSAAVGMTVSAEQNSNKNDQPITISGNMLVYLWTRGNAIIKNKFHKGVMKAFKKTPAYKSKFFQDVGDVGVTMVSNSDRISTSPMTGATKYTPSLLEQALNKIHPKFTEELEKYCNVLKGKLYLALPPNILGSIQYAINYINGVIASYAQIISEVYQGCLKAIKEFVAMLDAIMQPVMLWLLTLLERVVPLDIICLILDILSLFVGDITMYTNLFSQSVKISDFLNTFNIKLGPVNDFLSNPISTLKTFLPANVLSVVNLVDGAANDPMGYLGTVLGNYGYGYMMNYLKGDIMGGILNQFGSQAPILYPISGIMKKYGFNGKIQLTDPNSPSPNVVLPPGLEAMRRDIKRTFDSFGNSLDKTTEVITDVMFTTVGGGIVEQGQTSTPLAGITRV